MSGSRSIATLVVDAWNNFNGDYAIVHSLVFHGCESISLRGDEGGSNGGNGPCLDDLGYYEVEESGLIALNILFWSGAEFALKFRGVSVASRRRDLLDNS